MLKNQGVGFSLAPFNYKDENDNSANPTNNNLVVVREDDDTVNVTDVYLTPMTTAHAATVNLVIVHSSNVHQVDNILVSLE